MPYDSVYSEKAPAGHRRVPAWRNFYSDASAMVGLYLLRGLAVLCIWRLVCALRHDQQFSVINYCRCHGRAMAKFLSSWD